MNRYSHGHCAIDDLLIVSFTQCADVAHAKMQSEYATTYRSIPERSSAVLLNAATRVLHPACRGEIPCANTNRRTLTLNGEARVTKLRGTPAPPRCVEPWRNVGEWGQDKEAFVRCGVRHNKRSHHCSLFAVRVEVNPGWSRLNNGEIVESDDV
jgi:hypothetical protein